MLRVLTIEDDDSICDMLQEFFIETGFTYEICRDGKSGYEYFLDNDVDLILLDIGLPDMSGIDLLKQIRKESNIPIIMITGENDVETQLTCYHYHINDYLLKPFVTSILFQRIGTIFRYQKKYFSVRFGKIEVNFIQHQVKNGREYVDLTRTEYEILSYFAKHLNHFVGRTQLMTAVYGYVDSQSRLLDNHIKNLRKKIPGLPLKTIFGRGYKMERE